VERWPELWDSDIRQIETLVADEVVLHAAPIGQLTQAPMEGRETLRDWMTSMRAMLPTILFSIKIGLLYDGNMVVVRWRAQGQHGTARMDFTGTDILRICDGIIAVYWLNADALQMLQQAGMTNALTAGLSRP